MTIALRRRCGITGNCRRRGEKSDGKQSAGNGVAELNYYSSDVTLIGSGKCATGWLDSSRTNQGCGNGTNHVRTKDFCLSEDEASGSLCQGVGAFQGEPTVLEIRLIVKFCSALR